MGAREMAVESKVPPEEVARLVKEYRRLSFEHRSPPQMVYQGPAQFCPWPECGYRIAAIRFNLERMGDQAFYEDALASFWQGPGLVARCPGCGRHVLFGYEEKQTVEQPVWSDAIVLPDDWANIAYLVPTAVARPLASDCVHRLSEKNRYSP
jgi:hypothetical protein